MTLRYLVIGAGPSGLAMAKSLSDAQLEYDQVEADASLGGNWLHGVYRTVYTDACKDVMQFPDFPMPEYYPDFLSQSLMLNYLNEYADKFHLKHQIRFNTTVVWVQPIDENLWKVHFHDGLSKTYKGVIICNGHHWDKNHPALPGIFKGEYIHSKDYKEPDQLKNKRVLIIGSGNSAADIACEAARVSLLSVLSMRDSPWIFPKSFMGIPLGRIKAKNAPRIFDPLLVKLLLAFTFGKHERYGLSKPRHRPFEKHPTVSEELPYYLKHGRISVKPEIVKVENKTIWFDDQTFLDCDLIVAATGFKLSFPFLPDQLIRTDGQNLRCIGHCVYPDYKGIFFLGWLQVRGGIGSLAQAFSKVIVDLIKIEEDYNMPSGAVLKSMGNTISTTQLYGAKDIFYWIRKHQYGDMIKVARKIKTDRPHENIPLDWKIPENATLVSVY